MNDYEMLSAAFGLLDFHFERRAVLDKVREWAAAGATGEQITANLKALRAEAAAAAHQDIDGGGDGQP